VDAVDMNNISITDGTSSLSTRPTPRQALHPTTHTCQSGWRFDDAEGRERGGGAVSAHHQRKPIGPSSKTANKPEHSTQSSFDLPLPWDVDVHDLTLVVHHTLKRMKDRGQEEVR
jgi:hypothetical protein